MKSNFIHLSFRTRYSTYETESALQVSKMSKPYKVSDSSLENLKISFEPTPSLFKSKPRPKEVDHKIFFSTTASHLYELFVQFFPKPHSSIVEYPKDAGFELFDDTLNRIRNFSDLASATLMQITFRLYSLEPLEKIFRKDHCFYYFLGDFNSNILYNDKAILFSIFITLPYTWVC